VEPFGLTAFNVLDQSRVSTPASTEAGVFMGAHIRRMSQYRAIYTSLPVRHRIVYNHILFEHNITVTGEYCFWRYRIALIL